MSLSYAVSHFAMKQKDKKNIRMEHVLAALYKYFSNTRGSVCLERLTPETSFEEPSGLRIKYLALKRSLGD